MLDMGFLPDIRRVLRHIPKKRQTLFFSATMPPPIAELTREMLHDPVTINLERALGAGDRESRRRCTRCAQPVKAALLLKLLQSGEVQDALVFTRTKHRADRLAKYLARPQGVASSAFTATARRRSARRRSKGSRAAVTRCWSRPTSPRAASTSRRSVTSINFDVPAQPEDYIHRVGRTARAELTGSAFTLVSPEEEADVRAIEKAINRRLPRVTVPDFDYTSRAVAERLEVPHAQRIAEIRARKAEERLRARANAERRATNAQRQGQPSSSGRGPGPGRTSGRAAAGPATAAGRAAAARPRPRWRAGASRRPAAAWARRARAAPAGPASAATPNATTPQFPIQLPRTPRA